ncbi:hypothetical protein M408DRAFT_331922 [Serendipita vermifera MAFF 305830]|uniref:Uncharacterized protein n=1 Tax=Serendipita vermifera MAFF 305830 TaxID=933852 RepID=A0A0C2WCJ8_SERVB|nr:hypothetical protein M408DRAFT_331922 [Serendipita vermifera MAFF 305830]
MEQEIQRIWILVSELSEQLVQNNRVAADLRAQIQSLKEQADTATKATPLRRYNTDVSTEFFDSEVERTTVASIIENQSLLQENKQLNALMTDYEQTLETVMTKFRQHAQAASEKEMALVRHYESVLQNNAGQSSTQTYDLYTLKLSLERLSNLVWLVIKSESGEDAEGAIPDGPKPPMQNINLDEQETQIEALDRVLETAASQPPEESDLGLDWATERENEIARLEQENQELRRELGILRDPDDHDSEQDANLFGQRHGRTLSAPFGSGFITSPNVPSPQPSPLVPNPYSPAYPGAQGYNAPPTFSQPERRMGLPNRGGPIGPAPPQLNARNTFAEGTFGARQPPAFPNFFRGAPPARERLDLAGGQPPLL